MSNRGGVSCSAGRPARANDEERKHTWVPGSPAGRRAAAASPRRFYSRSAAGPPGGWAFWAETPRCCRFCPKSLSYRAGKTVNFSQRAEGCTLVSHRRRPPEPRRHLACPNCCVCSPKIIRFTGQSAAGSSCKTPRA